MIKLPSKSSKAALSRCHLELILPTDLCSGLFRHIDAIWSRQHGCASSFSSDVVASCPARSQHSSCVSPPTLICSDKYSYIDNHFVRRRFDPTDKVVEWFLRNIH